MNLVALKMLTGDRARYVAIIIGLTAASLLTTQQVAIFLGYMTRTWSFIDDTCPPRGGSASADLWVMNPEMEFTEDAKRMQDTDLLRVRGVEGVRWAVPLYKGVLDVRLSGGRETACAVIGIDDATLVGGPGAMSAGALEDLRRGDAVIVDGEQVRTKLAGRNASGGAVPLTLGGSLEINDHHAVVVGLCRITKPFFWQPVIYTTYTRALSFAPQQRRMLTFVLAKAQPGADPRTLCDRIRAQTGLAAYTNSGFKRLTASYVVKQTGIAVNFGMAVLLAFVIGTAIAGQTFYQFTHDHLRLFAMLKAMGASHGLLARMVLLQAITAGAVGYGLGVGAAALFGRVAGNTEIAFNFPWQLLVGCAAVVLLACLLPAVISLRKVMRMEPAIVFRA